MKTSPQQISTLSAAYQAYLSSIDAIKQLAAERAGLESVLHDAQAGNFKDDALIKTIQDTRVRLELYDNQLPPLEADRDAKLKSLQDALQQTYAFIADRQREEFSSAIEKLTQVAASLIDDLVPFKGELADMARQSRTYLFWTGCCNIVRFLKLDDRDSIVGSADALLKQFDPLPEMLRVATT